MRKLILSNRNLLFSVIVLSFYSCKETHEPINNISDIHESLQETVIKKWQLLGYYIIDSSSVEFPDTDHLAKLGFSEKDITFEEFQTLNKVDKELTKTNLVIKNDFLDLNKLYATDTISEAYAACIINSPIQQDVAFMCGSNDGVKIWVNNQLEFQYTEINILRKNDHCFKVHLKKGHNFILVKLINITPLWQFHLCLASVDYINKYNLYDGYECFSDKYIFNDTDSLEINFDTSIIAIDSIFKIKISDLNNEDIIEKDIKNSEDWRLDLSILKPAPYRCIINTDKYTFDHMISVGNYTNVFGNSRYEIENLIQENEKNKFLELIMKRIQSDQYGIKTVLNLRVLFLRLYELYHFDKTYGINGGLERKIANIYFELSRIADNISKNEDAFSNMKGKHLRSFKSHIDSTYDYYQLYIPKSYKKGKGIPLVVFVPFIEGEHREFYFSWHIAKQNKIDNIIKLSEKYGYACLWTSSRIYNKYNLNPIVSEATLEAINEVKNDYTIDDSKVFLFGSCSGGLSALILANRYPSKFASIFVEGADLSYTMCGKGKNEKCRFPSTWVEENNILNTPENYFNIPMKIVHSKNDEKAWIGASEQLVKLVNTYGTAYLDTIDHPSKTNTISMVTDNKVMAKAFEFFNKQTKSEIDKIVYSTMQLKYNEAYWITISNKEYDRKAYIEARIDKNNTIYVNSRFTKGYSINWKNVPNIIKDRKISVISNGVLIYKDIPKGNDIKITLEDNGKSGEYVKNHLVEGPINHLFSNSFILVKTTSGEERNKAFSDSIFYGFLKDWKGNFFEKCRIKNDIYLDENDIKNNHLILCGNQSKNMILKDIINKLPIELQDDYIKIGDKKIVGKNLHLNLLYPNPINKNKYILYLTSNGFKYYPNAIKDMPYKGWYDLEVYKDNNEIIYIDRFNKYWN